MSIRFIIIDGKSVSDYGYLQTYEHIPRGLPDKLGYYARSTDEEIIHYLDRFYQQIRDRREKIEEN